jgi:hypothetical protein
MAETWGLRPCFSYIYGRRSKLGALVTRKSLISIKIRERREDYPELEYSLDFQRFPCTVDLLQYTSREVLSA